MANRRCTGCGAINEEDAYYCRICGAFLLQEPGAGQPPRAEKSIWQVLEEQRRRGPAAPRAQAAPAERGEAWVRCPDCGQWEPAPGGRRPLQCSACNRFFQETDPLTDRRTPDPAPPARPAPPERQDAGAPADTAPRGPMRGGRQDRSALRLISQSGRRAFVLAVPAAGGVLGTGGNLRPELFGDGAFRGVAGEHLMLWHTDAGWYLRALGGRTLCNGMELNRGVSVPLSDGDLLHAGDCPMRVEIVRG